MPDGLGVLVVALGAATAFVLWRRRSDGTMREVGVVSHHPTVDQESTVHITAAQIGAPLGPRATLVQFSSAFCQPCRATRQVLRSVAEMVDGVVHVEIDAETHLDLVRRLHVKRTPTVFVLDGVGAVRNRASGTPRKVDVIAALGDFISTEEGAL